jgi:septal ring factor EnvC (AmiA/AmiB activator)
MIARSLATGVLLGALSLGGATVAHADPETPDPAAPCATQQAKVDKAEDALARVTAVFERKKDRVADAEAALAAAETDKEKAKAQRKLDRAKAKAADAKKEKKAQKKRLAKAQERLADCEAANPPAVA